MAAVVVVAAIVVGALFALGILPGESKQTSEGSTAQTTNTTYTANVASPSNEQATPTAAESEPETPAVDTGSFDINNATHYATCNLFLDNFAETEWIKTLDTANPDMDTFADWAAWHLRFNRSDLFEYGQYESVAGLGRKDEAAGYTGRCKLSDMNNATTRYTGVTLNFTNTTPSTSTKPFVKDGYYYFCAMNGQSGYMCLIFDATYLGNDTYQFSFYSWGPGALATESNGLSSLTAEQADAKKYTRIGTHAGSATVTIGDPADESTYQLVSYTSTNA